MAIRLRFMIAPLTVTIRPYLPLPGGFYSREETEAVQDLGHDPNCQAFGRGGPCPTVRSCPASYAGRMMADVEYSGTIWKLSVRVTPMRSGRSRANTFSCSDRSGQTG
jgi:hypothetical protein